MGGLHREEGSGRGPIEPPTTPRARLLPDLALPRYRYVPGYNAHPLRHPDGHGSILAHELALESAENWWTDRAYLYGFDLIHGRYLWECHEVWEARWKEQPKDSPRRWLLQGLIQCAAARLKEHLGDPATAARLRRASLDKLRRVQQTEGERLDGLILEDACGQVTEGNWPRFRVEGPASMYMAGSEGGR